MTKTQLHNIRREIVLTLAYPFFLITMLVLWILPTAWRRALTKAGGRLYYLQGKKARRYAIENLTKVYGAALTSEEIDLMARDVFTNLAGAFLDYYATVYIKHPKRYFRMVEVVGEEHLRRAYERGKGVVCLIPHLSSWELSAVTPPMMGYPTTAASKAIKSWCIQRTMVWFRARRGMFNFSRDGSYGKLVESLNRGDCMILMIDQDTRVKGCFVDFFGHTAYTPLGCARLAMDTGAAVVPMAMVRTSTGHYRFEIRAELPLIDTGNHEADLVANTQAETKAMEQFIAEHPTQWVWMHRRWRTTPESHQRFLEQRRAEKERQAREQH